VIDSHCHLDRSPGEAGELVADAAAVGVGRILTVGLDGESNRRQLAIAGEFPSVKVAVGRHPNDADGFTDDDAADIALLAGRPEVVAIGETGLDFYRDTAQPDSQRAAFEAQIGIAADAGLPLVIHLRDRQGSDAAAAEAFELLDRAPDGLAVILHCFSIPDRVEEATERGWYCSFAGNVTYPANGALREAAARVPDELILVETDAPYLTPQSNRRERNVPANVVETAEAVAEVRGVTYAELDRTVTANAERVFGW
jgi:TatD DNase family protein